MELIVQLIADWLLILLALSSVALIVFCTKRERRYSVYVRILLAGLTTYMAAKFVGLLFQPEVERPFQKMGVEPLVAYLDNPGFPSDHVLFAMFLALAVLYATGKKRVFAVLVCATLAMGVARVIGLVHTPLDIAGGVALAFVGVTWYGLNVKNMLK